MEMKKVEPPAKDGSMHEVVLPLTPAEILAVRELLANMERIVALCPIAARAVSKR